MELGDVIRWNREWTDEDRHTVATLIDLKQAVEFVEGASGVVKRIGGYDAEGNIALWIIKWTVYFQWPEHPPVASVCERDNADGWSVRLSGSVSSRRVNEAKPRTQQVTCEYCFVQHPANVPCPCRD